MHKDLFDKCREAVERGFFFEAVLLEYAGIEGRLEAMPGILGMPCSKDTDKNQRIKILISNRINCLK